MSYVEIDFESQILALFDTFPLIQFSKFNNFLWVCWFLGKNLSNYVPPTWKLNNLYYHSFHPYQTYFVLVQNVCTGFVFKM
jgi:hypothetical protein